MRKELLLIAALTAPNLAYADANNTLNGPQVVNASASAPAAPAPAQAAGFTTCIICMDFTAPTGGVWVNGSQPAGVNAAQANLARLRWGRQPDLVS